MPSIVPKLLAFIALRERAHPERMDDVLPLLPGRPTLRAHGLPAVPATATAAAPRTTTRRPILTVDARAGPRWSRGERRWLLTAVAAAEVRD